MKRYPIMVLASASLAPTPEDYAFVDRAFREDPTLAQRHTRDSFATLRADVRNLSAVLERATPKQRKAIMRQATPMQRRAILIVEHLGSEE